VLRNPADPVRTTSDVPFCFGQSHVEVMSVGPSAHGLWLWIHSMALCPSRLATLSLSLLIIPASYCQIPALLVRLSRLAFSHYIYPTLFCSLPLYTKYSKPIHRLDIHYAHVVSNSQQHSVLLTKARDSASLPNP
jgi:hypothetical protein